MTDRTNWQKTWGQLVRGGRGRPQLALRLWPVGLLILFAERWPLALPLLSLGGIAVGWEVMSAITGRFVEYSAKDPRQNRRHRLLAFLAGISLCGGLVIVFVESLSVTIGNDDNRLAFLVIAVSALGCWLAYRVVALAWKISYIVSASILMIAFGCVACVVAARPIPANVNELVVWGQSLVRLLLVFGAAMLAELAARRRTRLARTAAELLPNALSTVGFLMALALIPDRYVAGWIWGPLLAGLGAVVALTLWRGQRSLARDRRWFGRLWSGGGESAPPVPESLALQACFVPPLALVPGPHAVAWIVVFGLSLFAALLVVGNTRANRVVVAPARLAVA